ncbi:PorP/SprF family type IX secretion system membrane protein [Aquirufa sp. ROCK-SH2]
MDQLIKTLRVEKASTRNWGHLTPISLVALFMLFLMSTQVKAQIETMYSLYRFNPQVLTPVQAGSTPNSEMILMYRNQWVGIEGAPRNLGLSGNFKWGQKKGIGIGALVDEAGPVRSTILSADFAYHAKLNENWNLDGGIRMGMANIALNLSNIRLVNANDNLFAGDRSTGIQPNLGWGLRLAKHDDGFFVSVSQPRVLKYDFGTYSGAFRDVAYYYAMAGTKIGLGGKVETPNGLRSRVTLYPSLLVRLAADVPLSYDLNLTANLKGKLDVGLSYRREDSYGLRLGVQATKKIYLGYVFELPISEIRKASSQTHEMAIRFFIFDKKKEEKKDELKIEESEMKQKDFGPYEKKEQAEPLKQEIKQEVNQPTQQIKQEVKQLPETTQKSDLVEKQIVEQTKPKTVAEDVKKPVAETLEAKPAEAEEEYEYVTVTKTRVVRTRPKVTNKTITSTVKTQGASKQVATSAVKTNTQTKTSTATVVNKSAANAAKPAVKKKPVVKAKPKPASPSTESVSKPVAEALEAKPVDPNAPKVTKKRISNNVTETIVEKKGGSETQVGIDGSAKVTKRKRKDGTEETVYTTTEVVRKKKEK